MKWTLVLGGALLVVTSLVGFFTHVSAQGEPGKRLITVYDRGSTVSFLTDARTIDDALVQESIALDPRDTVEPSRDEELLAPEYKVNIYRARPVIVVDGAVRTKVMTPYQSSHRIVQDADIELFNEDRVKVAPSTEYVGDGAGLVVTIDRAILFTFDLYGTKNTARTHADTLAGMLAEKGVTLGENDRVSLPLDTRMTPGLEVRVWREGKQTISEEQPVPFAGEFVYDADRPLGYRAIQNEGAPGVDSVTYEIEVRDGVEISRQEIARIRTVEPVKRSLVIGISGLENGLTRSRGALHFTDSRGVVHRETYYDLPMSRVMQSCGQGGRYTVRFDGMKIDAEGYIIIAANYGNYPKCSIVETSAGPGRVYDTGGFALRHPHGFDLATDWSNPNGI